MRKRTLFAATFFITLGVSLVWLYLDRPKPPAKKPLVRITEQVFITSQLGRGELAAMKQSGMKTIIDIRPDGEASDQTPSSEIKQAADERGLAFHYIPVPHETIPDDAVAALASALKTAERPALLYCRTGRRAVRLFALTEASRHDGPDADAILRMVVDAGFSADDLRENIAHRIGNRVVTKNPN